MFMNDKLIEQFDKLVVQTQYLMEKTKNYNLKYKISSFKHAIHVIKNFKFPITSSDQLANIPGIGVGIINRIDDIINNGKLTELKNFDSYNNAINNLTKIFGIGQKKAFELFVKYNITSIDDLKKAINTNKIHLSDTIIKGIEFYDKVQEHIPREEIDKIFEYFLDIINGIDEKIHFIFCGSYRRLHPYPNDIDVIVTYYGIDKNNDILYKIIKTLKKINFIVASFTDEKSKTKYMGICKYKNYPLRRIDIRYISQKSYYFALLYFTGSKNFNKKMRLIALSLGYTLNEYGLFNKQGKLLLLPSSEKEIFDKLNVPYVSPENR